MTNEGYTCRNFLSLISFCLFPCDSMASWIIRQTRGVEASLRTSSFKIRTTRDICWHVTSQADIAFWNVSTLDKVSAKEEVFGILIQSVTIIAEWRHWKFFGLKEFEFSVTRSYSSDGGAEDCHLALVAPSSIPAPSKFKIVVYIVGSRGASQLGGVF